MLQSTGQPGSEATAGAILRRYVESAQTEMADVIEAIVLTGSLATNSYVTGPGDIDQITILHDTATSDAENQVNRLIDAAMSAFGRSVNLAPVVYRRRDLDRPWATEWDLRPETRHLVTVPEELLRIHDHGQVLLSAGLRIADLPCPTRQEMVAYHLRCGEWNREFAARNPSLDLASRPVVPLRIAVQVILSRAIWHYYFATGRTCFNKHLVAGQIRREVPGYRFLDLVDLATKVRTSGFAASPQEETLLSAGTKTLLQWLLDHAVDAVPMAS